MNKKNIVFISIVISISALLFSVRIFKNITNDGYDVGTKMMKNNENVEGTDREVELNETVTFRIQDGANMNYGEDIIEMKVTSAELADTPREEDIHDETFKRIILGSVNKFNQRVFFEELRYLYVVFELKNTSKDKDIELSIEYPYIAVRNKYGDELEKIFGSEYIQSQPRLPVYHVGICESYFRVINDDGTKNDMKNETFVLNGGKTYKFEYIGAVMPGDVYDLYFTTSEENGGMYELAGVRLDIALHETTECNPYDGTVSVYQKRDLKQLKINSKYTNYSYFAEQDEIMHFGENHFLKYGSTAGNSFEQSPGEFTPVKEMNVLEAKLIENEEELPDRFRNSKYLEEMLQVYLEQLPYETKEYRFIYVKARLKELGNLKIQGIIPQYMWLYNRDENNNLWRFGYPDDYYILSSTNDKQTIQYSTLAMEQNEELVVEAVYIVVPDTIYDLYIYNDGGVLCQGDEREGNKLSHAAISLDMKLQEKGGIK